MRIGRTPIAGSLSALLLALPACAGTATAQETSRPEEIRGVVTRVHPSGAVTVELTDSHILPEPQFGWGGEARLGPGDQVPFAPVDGVWHIVQVDENAFRARPPPEERSGEVRTGFVAVVTLHDWSRTHTREQHREARWRAAELEAEGPGGWGEAAEVLSAVGDLDGALGLLRRLLEADAAGDVLVRSLETAERIHLHRAEPERAREYYRAVIERVGGLEDEGAGDRDRRRDEGDRTYAGEAIYRYAGFLRVQLGLEDEVVDWLRRAAGAGSEPARRELEAAGLAWR